MSEDAEREVTELVWPLAPMCGVLGVASTWHVPFPTDAATPAAARQAVHRQLTIWKVDVAVSGTVQLLISQLVASAARYGGGALFLEVARTPGHIGVAVREAVPTGWATPDECWEDDRGLRLTAALAPDLSVLPVPGGNGYAFAARVPDGYAATSPSPSAPVRVHALN